MKYHLVALFFATLCVGLYAGTIAYINHQIETAPIVMAGDEP